jgi:hypothetical protein
LSEQLGCVLIRGSLDSCCGRMGIRRLGVDLCVGGGDLPPISET